MSKSTSFQQILSRAGKFVGALLEPASLFSSDAKSDTGCPSNPLSAFIKVLIRLKNA
jgi:hypothetical protein